MYQFINRGSTCTNLVLHGSAVAAMPAEASGRCAGVSALFGAAAESQYCSAGGVDASVCGFRDDILKYPRLFVYLTGRERYYLHIPEKKCNFAGDMLMPTGVTRFYLHNEDITFDEKSNSM